ncbi:MAG TPA: hypothetical protein DCQ31_16350, partial [Bacteroidales bacterium]|nr:hypothetical protein [Bacteroidales bacterium]
MLHIDEEYEGRNYISIKFPIVAENKTLVGGYTIDITERKQYEQKLHYWQEIFNHAKWGIVVGNNVLELMNNEFAAMHGFTVEELTNMPIETVFAPESRPHIMPQIAIAEQKGHHIWEAVHVRKDGSTFPVTIDVT